MPERCTADTEVRIVFNGLMFRFSDGTLGDKSFLRCCKKYSPNLICSQALIVIHGLTKEMLLSIYVSVLFISCPFIPNYIVFQTTQFFKAYKLRPLVWSGHFRRQNFNPLNAELNPVCYLLALLGAHHFLHVSRIRVKALTFRLLMSYIYGAPILDVSRSHTTTQHSR